MSLGKGLGSLIPEKTTVASINKQSQASQVNQAPLSRGEISISDISINPHQPRRHFNHQQLEDLVNSIKVHGILQPLIVTKIDVGYELIAGERRLKASKIAGLKQVPVVIRLASDLEKLELALIENIQRADLNPIEKAMGYKKLVEEFGLTQDEGAKKVGISRSAFTNALRLLKLPTEIQIALSENKITEGHAKIILSLPSAGAQKAFLNNIITNKLSVRSSESSLGAKKKKISWQDPQYNAWENELNQYLGTKVSLKKKGDGGTMIIEYYSASELKNIIKQITG